MKKIFLLFCLTGFSLCSSAQLQAEFDWCPQYDTTAQLCCIQFHNLSIDTGGTVTSYDYIFGDGQQSTQSDPQHCYVVLGTYLVSLIVTDNLGNSDTVFHPIAITHLDTTGCHCDSLSGINSVEYDMKTQVYPNPFHSAARIEMNSGMAAEKNCKLIIYSAMGTEVRRKQIPGLESISIGRMDLPDGVYYYKIQSDDHPLLSSGKFILN